MSYTEYSTTISLDLGAAGDCEFDIMVDIDDEWIREQCFEWVLTDDIRADIANDYLDELTEAQLLELFAEKVGVTEDELA